MRRVQDLFELTPEEEPFAVVVPVGAVIKSVEYFASPGETVVLGLEAADAVTGGPLYYQLWLHRVRAFACSGTVLGALFAYRYTGEEEYLFRDSRSALTAFCGPMELFGFDEFPRTPSTLDGVDKFLQSR